MSYLLSSALSLLVRSDKPVVGLALRLCLAALSDLSAPISDLISFNSLEISPSLLSNEANSLLIDNSETNRTTIQESKHAIATKYTIKRNRSDVKRFDGFRSLRDSCSISSKVGDVKPMALVYLNF